MRSRRAPLVALSIAVASCTSFDVRSSGSVNDGGAKDGGTDAPRTSQLADATVAMDARRDSTDRAVDVDRGPADVASDAPDATACAHAWQKPRPGASCAGRQLFTVMTGLGALHILRIARAFGGNVALLFDAKSDAGRTLTLAIVDPATGAVESTTSVATATSFDSAALAYDDRGTLSVAYHAGPGDPVFYAALDAGLTAGSPEVVVTDVGPSQLALSTIPQPGPDAGAPGPLGYVPGDVGLAWFPMPEEANDFAASSLYLLSRQEGAWSQDEAYGYTIVRSDLALSPNAQRGVTASAIAYSAKPDEPYESCTWQMAGRVSSCGTAGQVLGISLALGPSAAFLVFTFPDPATGVTTLDVGTDTDGSYTFPVLSTITTFASAAQQGVAEPRAGLSGTTLAVAVIYPTTGLPYAVDLATWDTVTSAVTTEAVTTVMSESAEAPALDLVVDVSGTPTLAIADPGSGSILLARAVLPAPVDASADAR